jgi:NAD-dependent DNA ligase
MSLEKIKSLAAKFSGSVSGKTVIVLRRTAGSKLQKLKNLIENIQKHDFTE